MTQDTEKRRRPLTRIAALFILVGVFVLTSALLRHPGTPLPPRWNVFEPLRVSDALTPLTSWKLDWATSDAQLCLSIVQDAARVTEMDDLIVNENCGIKGRLTVHQIGDAKIAPVETACGTTLRLAMWVEHGLQPDAQDIFGQKIARLRHIGSYNCRAIRNSSRWSTHSTASAIDITGFDLEDGTRISLIKDWGDGGDKGEFLRFARDTSCDWFGTTLGPDYNALHADHFHLQNKGWGTCR